MSFGTSPVKDAYWGILNENGEPVIKACYGSQHEMRLRPSTMGNLAPGDTVVIKSIPYDILEQHDDYRAQLDLWHDLSLYAKAYLGILQTKGYRFNKVAAILDDSWVINLRDTNMNGQKLSEELKKRWEGKDTKPMQSIDLTSEMKDLLKTYENACTYRNGLAKNALDHMYRATKQWIECHEAKMKEDDKLAAFKLKMKDMEILPEDQEPKSCCMGD